MTTMFYGNANDQNRGLKPKHMVEAETTILMDEPVIAKQPARRIADYDVSAIARLQPCRHFKHIRI